MAASISSKCQSGTPPYIIIIIDELADLMMLDRANGRRNLITTPGADGSRRRDSPGAGDAAALVDVSPG